MKEKCTGCLQTLGSDPRLVPPLCQCGPPQGCSLLGELTQDPFFPGPLSLHFQVQGGGGVPLHGSKVAFGGRHSLGPSTPLPPAHR